jgi:uncharacterized damage-inducible protein DinB
MTLDEQGRTEPLTVGGAVGQVSSFHSFLRETLLWKCSGLTEEQLRWSPVLSGTCLLGILKHSVYVERWWISRYIGGLDVRGVSSEEDPDADWRIEPGESFETIRELYLAEGERSRNVLSAISWDQVPEDPTGRKRTLSVGWILTHMVEEVGRHCGHADLIRELIDGQVGE